MGRRLGVVAAACLASAGLLLGGLAFVVLSMFPSEPAVEVRHGVAGAEFDRWWRSYHLTLPDRVDELRWCQTRTWDLNEIYLRFGTDRAGLHALLGELGSPPARLHHVRRTRAFATAPTNGWGDAAPVPVRSWGPHDWTDVRGSSVLHDRARWLVAAEVMVEDAGTAHPTVYLELSY